MRSSYIENNYGEVFRFLVRFYKPVVSVEIGVLDGYSLKHIALAMKAEGINGLVCAYDLFEDYEFKHGSREKVWKMLKEYGLIEYVQVEKEDAYKVSQRFKDNSVDFLHVDISNTGRVVDKIVSQWDRKMRKGGVIVFEGGSEERDQIDWMVKYKKPKIATAIKRNKILKSGYKRRILFTAYPSLTVLVKNEKGQ